VSTYIVTFIVMRNLWRYSTEAVELRYRQEPGRRQAGTGMMGEATGL
jgi:hypothetical protein